jgi:hypothetical protein
MVALMCLGKYIQANNLVKRIMGLYLYPAGARRQTINGLSKIGLFESYGLMSHCLPRSQRQKNDSSSLASQGPQPSPQSELLPPSTPTNQATSSTEPQEGQRLGTLYQLSDSVHNEAREIAATGKYGVVYDNVNINFSNAEQILS